MKEILTAIERHLGRTVGIQQLDYYQVIGLDLYCSDPTAIRKALQDATNRWMQSETGSHPESAQLVAKLLKQAQLILLDPEKRERYNAQLKDLRSSQASAAADVSNEVQSTSSLFPTADPMAPFAMDSATLGSSPTGQCALLEQIRDPQTRLAELQLLFPSLAELDYPVRIQSDDDDALVAKRSRSDELSSSVSLAQQLRRKRTQRRILLSACFVIGSLVILGGAVWAYFNNRSQLQSKRTKDFAFRQVDPARRPSLPEPAQVTRDSDSASAPVKKPEPMRELPSVPKPETPQPAPPEPAPPEPAPLPMPEPQSPPTEAAPMMTGESAEWRTLMASMRSALEREDFGTFEKEIARGLETAQTPLGRDQAARLDQLGQLFKIGTESFQEARKKTRGTSSIKVGTTEFSIVESTPEKLVVRSAGKNQSHAWEKLPFGIANALLDLSLDTSDPTDLAARAVYFSLAKPYREDAIKSEIMKKRIAGWFEKSVGQGGIRTDLPQALTDTYE